MVQASDVKLRRDRRGIVFAGREVEGFPYVAEMSPGDQLKVARWARRLAPGSETDEQKALVEGHAVPEPSDKRLEGLYQDQMLRLPQVRSLWRRLGETEQAAVVNPENSVGKRYPLNTKKLAQLTGLSERQVRYWSDLGLLPHWLDDNGYRHFEAAAAIVAFSLVHRSQPERQFYAELGASERPMDDAQQALSLVCFRLVDLVGRLDAVESEEMEDMLRSAADNLREARTDFGSLAATWPDRYKVVKRSRVGHRRARAKQG
ncbi:MAG TPA: MerR family DNA-binding transcriptional regulator [Solirubrobacteraceae bacterium]|nr:MerR family DNA-binding transcriptional regulator [Solirubrobacteraceae bacterium]